MYEAKIADMDCDTNPNISTAEKSVAIFTDVYKYRSSRDKRAFIPPTANESSQIPQTSDEFIALGSDFDSIDDKNCTTTMKNKRYVNIDKEEHTEESKDIKKNQFFDKLKLIDNNADSIKHIKNDTLKRNDESKPNYLSLKLKRIQKNKRRKVAKLAKKKRIKEDNLIILT